MTRATLEAHIRAFLTYGNADDVAVTEQWAYQLIGGIVDGETHASFKDRAASRLPDDWLAIMKFRGGPGNA